MYAESNIEGYQLVLIETYWNVNLTEAVLYLTESVGLNRNILECKSFYSHF